MTKKYLLPGDSIDDAEVVRTAVFVEEQGFSKELEFDDIDAVAYHVVFYNDNSEPIATGRIFEDKENAGRYIMGRIAVLKELRGTGLGAKVVLALEEQGKEVGAKILYLGAQDHAAGFYKKLGYKVCGDQYMDEHVVHFPMEKEV